MAHNAAMSTHCTINTSNPVTELTDLDSWEVFTQASAVKRNRFIWLAKVLQSS